MAATIARLIGSIVGVVLIALAALAVADLAGVADVGWPWESGAKTKGWVDAARGTVGDTWDRLDGDNPVILYRNPAGRLDHNPQVRSIKELDADVEVADFRAEVSFGNPYDRSTAAWTYGFLFRDTGANQEYRLYVRSTEQWRLSLVDGDPKNPVSADSGAITNLDTESGGTNTLVLIADGDAGAFFVNDTLVARLDLGEKLEAGDVAVATGLRTDDEYAGESTFFEDFVVSEP